MIMLQSTPMGGASREPLQQVNTTTSTLRLLPKAWQKQGQAKRLFSLLTSSMIHALCSHTQATAMQQHLFLGDAAETPV